MARTRTRTAFLSSTGADLTEYREKAYQAINRLDGWKCVRMEDFGARHWDVDSFCKNKVAECDLFIGIIGHRFGSHPKGSKQSYTQREYAAAKRKPRLMFVAWDKFPVPADLHELQWKRNAQIKFRKLVRSTDLAPDFKEPLELTNLITAAIHHWEREAPEQASEPTVKSAEDPTKYLEALHQDTANIEIRGFQTGQKEGYRFPIAELYTPLTTMLLSEKALKRGHRRFPPKMERQRPVPLQQALRKGNIVIVGDPGAGKTTFLRRIAFACCQTLLDREVNAAAELLGTKKCPFPIMISAAGLSGFITAKTKLENAPARHDAPEWLPFYLAWICRDSGWGLSNAFFTRQLEREGALLLLDGLDEAPNPASRQDLANMVKRAAARFAATKIVVTSRPAAYGGETNIDGFTKAEIGPLDESAVGTFLDNWCRLLYKGDEASARQHLAELREAIQSRVEIADMAVNAVMLTALAVVHWNEKRLPDQRAELYKAVLHWLARRSEERLADVRADRRLELMAELAFAMHTAEGGKRVEIEPFHAAEAIAPRYRDLPEKERIAAAGSFLDEEELHSGIVVLRNGKLRFWHQTFQEYLAARYLGGDDDARERIVYAETLYRAEWRETALLLAGVMHSQSERRMDALLKSLLDRADNRQGLPARARCVGLIGAMLKDLTVTNYRTNDPRWSEFLAEVLAIFTPEAARTIDFPTRLAAADAIGQGHDPRLDGNNWVRIEGGTFWMGAQKTDENKPNFDSEAFDNEGPVRQVTVKTFEIGRYPVTVQEYALFLNAKVRKQPEDWRSQLRYPSRPVVNVTWHDAEAYAKWKGCRLPTEAEWEYAARNGSAGTKYPWGNEPLDASRANYRDAGPGHPTPVGLYADGATSAGVQDMAGNVWEWTVDWYGPYDVADVAYPVGPTSGDHKALRGGSWFSLAGNGRVSFRLWIRPGVRFYYLGFRCVREVP